MKQETIEKLKSLCLAGFVQALKEQDESATYIDMSFEERLSFLVDSECLRRKNNRIQAALRFAKLKPNASIEELDYSAQRNLKKNLIAELADCTWVKKAQNIIITGPTGVGKSFLASALAEKACRLEVRTLNIKINELLRQIMLAHAEGTYPKLIAKFSKIPLLVIDEWLRNPLSAEQAREILDLVDERYQKLSTVFCSQLPVKNWHQAIKDPTAADAILDRIVHQTHRIELSGDSLRKKKTGEGVASLR
ncbi:MAG: IS21-like element helper ATPase IstB [bacterium]|nr:IS21-like element helper ATPase IstB [bacterium]